MLENIHYGFLLSVLIGWVINRPKWIKRGFIVGFLGLVWWFIQNDYSLYLSLPPSSWSHWLKVAAIWSSHEGSIVLALVYLICLIPKDYPRLTPFSICSGYLWLTTNPFLKRGEIYLESQESLSLLQDPLLLIHPPILYLGFLALIRPFLRWREWVRYQIVDIPKLKRDLAYSGLWSLLGLGLGSWWAYLELGWGGYWFWDPVENLALMTVILILISFHFVRSQMEGKALWLSSFTFVWVLFSTLMIRSGWLNSIHIFVSHQMIGLTLLGFGLLGIVIRYGWKQRNSLTFPTFYVTSLSLMKGSSFIGVGIVFSLLVGTCLPQVMEISLGSEVFKSKLLPWVSLLVWILWLTPFSSFSILEKMGYTVGNLWIFWFILPKESLQNDLLILFSTLLLFSLVRERYLLKRTMFWGHLGVAVWLLSVGVQNSLELVDLYLWQGEERIQLAGYYVDLLQLSEKTCSTYHLIEGQFVLSSPQGRVMGELYPSWIYHPLTQELVIKTASLSNGVIDWFCTMERDQLRLGYQPAISFLWVALFLFLYSMLLCLAG
jgi:cytochrome c-type biogenesis protein CcmF